VIVQADTLAELAPKAGLPADELSSTVERFNGFARSGVDEEPTCTAARSTPLDVVVLQQDICAAMVRRRKLRARSASRRRAAAFIVARRGYASTTRHTTRFSGAFPACRSCRRRCRMCCRGIGCGRIVRTPFCHRLPRLEFIAGVEVVE
jgi:hypothetical protein